MVINRKLGHEILITLNTNFSLHVRKIDEICENVLVAYISHHKQNLKYLSTLDLSQKLYAANQIITRKLQNTAVANKIWFIVSA